MRNAAVAMALAAVACATAPPEKHFIQRKALAQIEPVERDQLFAQAVNTLQRRGWMIAVVDRTGGLVTTQTMATRPKPCGPITCDSSSTLQVAITDTVISVNLRREFVNPETSARFASTHEQDVTQIEEEQESILEEILSGPRAGAPPASPGVGVRSCCKICTVGKACGDTCISRQYTCHVGPGCACDASP